MSFTKRTKQFGSAIKKLSKPVYLPKPYQKQAIKFGLSRPAAGFFLAPGLGKTSISLYIFKILKERNLVDEMFVLATKRIVHETWPREINKWNGVNFKCSTVHGPRKEEALYAKADIRLMNYDGIPWLAQQKRFRQELLKKNLRVMLVVDESSKLRNTRTQRFKKLKKLLPLFKRRYILTGSPAPNGLMNLFGQVYLLDLGESLGQFVTHYRMQYFYPTGFGGYQWALQDGADERIFEKISPLIIRFGTDQLDLPPITWVDRFVELPAKARKAYDEMESELLTQWKNDELIAANAAVASGKCRQIANGHAPGEKRQLITLHDEKCEELTELLEELNGEPALVGYQYHHDREQLQKYFKARAPEFASAPFIDSKTKDRDVSKYINQWEEGELPVMFGNVDSVAHGLNLQGHGGIVIYYSLTWDLENYEQFYQRVWRQGQRRRVIVYRIIARNTVDEDVLASLARKDTTQRGLLRAMEKRHER